MTDMEKVIKCLEACTGEENDCAGHTCPYWDYDGEVGCRTQMELDALALLKEHDTQKFLVDENGKITPLPIVFPKCPLKEQEVKTGKWIEQTDYLGDTYYDCSVCNESWITIEGTPWVNGMNYCPHCGAKMEFEGR